jgi:hypothetical protein
MGRCNGEQDGSELENTGATLHSFDAPSHRIQRLQRHPQYSDEELKPWFAEVAKGYPFDQAAERCGYVVEWIMNNVYSDDEVFDHALTLSINAGARIRAGELPIPDRHDGLYKERL